MTEPGPLTAASAYDLTEPIVGDGLTLVLVPGDVLLAVTDAEGGAVDWPGVGTIDAELTARLPASMRVRQLEADPDLAAWLVRGIVVTDPASPTGQRVVGHLGGHDRPDADGMVEAGYSVTTADRGQGLATRGTVAWFSWAHRHGARTARLSIEPGNAPSLGIARRLGLTETGRAWDDGDQVWETVLSAPLPLRPLAE